MSLVKIKQSELPELREIQAEQQGGKCPITGYFLGDDKVADHCHKTGMHRGTLPSWVNSRLGKIENAARAMGKHLSVPETLRRCATYVEQYEREPTYLIHHTHKTPDEKKEAARLKRNKAARAKRAATKAAQ
ncbi:endonuclease domain-containing protein [Paraburkholderia fungorum]|uniref:endonuclease domain-containing protein n=1 Tax=Paraburkholderia fungorum TaxID=134537 RepID=UPI0038B72756